MIVITACAALIRLLMAGGNWLLATCGIAPHQQRLIYGYFAFAGLLLLVAVYLNEFRRDLLRKLLPAKHLESAISIGMLIAILAVSLGPAVLTLLAMEKGPTWDCWLGPIFMSMLVSIVGEFSAIVIAITIIACYQIASTLPSLLRHSVA